MLRRPVAAESEGGFTLVELLVAMAAAMVIVAAIFSMLDVTMHQTSRTFSAASATSSARSATAVFEAEMHSACVYPGMAPVLSGSTGSTITFVSMYGSSAVLNAAAPTPVKHTLTYASANGTITDTTYAATGGSNGNWTFSATGTSTLLATNVSQVGTTPVFQYFKYVMPMNGSTLYTDAAGNSYMMIEDGINFVPGTNPAVVPAAAPLTVPLSATDAASTVEVLLNLGVGPQVASGEVGSGLQAGANVTATVHDQGVLRLTTAGNHVGSGTTFMPCG